jgi:hypothetical protein
MAPEKLDHIVRILGNEELLMLCVDLKRRSRNNAKMYKQGNGRYDLKPTPGFSYKAVSIKSLNVVRLLEPQSFSSIFLKQFSISIIFHPAARWTFF